MCVAPAESKDQEVCFVLGRNNNKMRVRSHTLGKGKILGWMAIDVNDPRVLEHSRHNIYEAGLGNLIEQTIKQKLPPDFQTAEFLMKHGMLDIVTPRRELRSTISKLLGLYRA